MSFMKAAFESGKRKIKSSHSQPGNRTVDEEINANRSTSEEQHESISPTDVRERGAPAPSSCSAVASHKENNGLLPLNPSQSFSNDTHDRETYPVDIVAVHGLAGGALKTWTHENGKLWLRDFLPNDLPGARIFSFGYPAELFASHSTGNFDYFCRSLLEDLKRERIRQEHRKRALVFICHSMGGIVVKKALVTALLEDNLFGGIRTSVVGIMFLGTPHRGSSETQLPIVLTGIANIVLTGTSRITVSMRTDLLKALQKASPTLKEISTNFRNQTKNINIASFIEVDVTPPAKKRIVDDISGIMDIPGERIVPMMNCNHKNICRFGEESSEGYQTILGVLRDWVEELDQMTPSQGDLPCLHSLAFPEMDWRRLDATRAYPNTCKWILQHKSYNTWLSGERELLWLKGKPGSGKSTLLAFVHQKYKQRSRTKRVINLDFYFHGRGVPLQKAPEGMFRSLLHQFFIQCPLIRPPVRAAFEKQKLCGEPGKDWSWHSRQLEDLLFNAVTQAAESYMITIFVDALDEAGSEVGSELTSYFHRLKDEVSTQTANLRICISCRHYPVIPQNASLEVSVENENRDDISTYVRNEISPEREEEDSNTDSTDEWHALTEEVIGKASGVFQWARLVVPMINRLRREGESLSDIRQRLSEVPEGLGEVYQHIIENIIKARNRPRTFLMMQWICFAVRPLSVIELRYAMASDCLDSDKSLHSCEKAKDFVDTDKRMKKLVTTLSGGLAEVREHETTTTVQLIHQSVKEFLLSNGLEYLAISSQKFSAQGPRPWIDLANEDISDYGHQRLSRSCINYLKLKKVTKTTRDEFDQSFDRLAHRGERLRIHRRLPFIDYATKFWAVHAEKAERLGVLQQDLVQQFNPSNGDALENWVELYRHFYAPSYPKPPRKGSTLLHVASIFNLQSTVQALLRPDVCIEREDDQGAACLGNKEAVSTLIKAHAEVDATNQGGETALILAIEEGHVEMVKLLLHHGANTNIKTGGSDCALYAAARYQDPGLIQMLLDAGADVNVQSEHFGNALHVASFYGHEIIVQRLLKTGINVNAQGGKYGNALQTAIFYGYEIIVQQLLDAGANVNVQGGKYGNALQAASLRGYEIIVQRLLKIGANVNAQGGDYGNALQAASFCGSENIVQQLLKTGANVNAQGGEYGNALQAASLQGNEIIVQQLLDAGANVNAQNGKYGNALQAALFQGVEVFAGQVIMRANVNAQDGSCHNGWQATVKYDKTAKSNIVQQLLEAGAETQGHEDEQAMENISD